MADVYNFDYPRCGRALIISNENFLSRDLKTLAGSQRDVDSLGQALGHLGFKTEKHRDLYKKDIKQLIKSVAEEDHTDDACLVVCFMSHGDEDGMGGVDYDTSTQGGIIGIDDIVDPFLGHRCPSLVGKPKIFIFNACRGGCHDYGMEVTDGAGARGDQKSTINRIPASADVLLIFSTCDGYNSYTNEDLGSPFINCLSEELIQKGKSTAFHDIMLAVQGKVAAYASRVKVGGRYKTTVQMPVIQSTLRKRVCFNNNKRCTFDTTNRPSYH